MQGQVRRRETVRGLDGEPFTAEARELLGTFRHTVTTRKIEFVVYAATVARRTKGYEWIENVDDVPHPSYVRKALRFSAG